MYWKKILLHIFYIRFVANENLIFEFINIVQLQFKLRIKFTQI